MEQTLISWTRIKKPTIIDEDFSPPLALLEQVDRNQDVENLKKKREPSNPSN